jgi:hypothetical protein
MAAVALELDLSRKTLLLLLLLLSGKKSIRLEQENGQTQPSKCPALA